jgi:hypothetical protein
MTSSADSNKVEPNELTLFSVQDSIDEEDDYPSTLWALFRGVEEGFEITLLTKIIEALPTLLPVLGDSDLEDRLKHFCQTLQIEDWRPNAESEMLLNGRMEVERFFKEVPLLTEDEVTQRLPPHSNIELSELMQFRYNDQTFYLADQFTADGSVHTECLACWRILKTDPESHPWENAMWWMYGNSWLGGPSPRDIYKERPEQLFHAAEQETLKGDY